MTIWFRQEKNALLLFLRVTPNAARDQIEPPIARDDGSWRLPLRVRAVPDKGAANKAVAALLAKQLGLPKSAITIESGATNRLKTVRIDATDSTQQALIDKLKTA
ncbi:MAG: DUF167 domain-containing protein [Hyphomicrobiaceae bacterium]|nr:DUF167 domain-containing protein [Hyphomicrobiaceae bacterium]MCC0024969.1 DUF167 domain-containing protein [Hyphomicrobiaceae bacterium]